MAHFRGVVQGMRGPASRLGAKTSGLVLMAQSWEGTLMLRLYYDKADNHDHYSLRFNKTGVVVSGRIDGTEAKILEILAG